VIDLIVATVDRTEEPHRLLRSLEAQTFTDFRLIVVDQNDDERLDPVLEPFARVFPVLHLRSEGGNSRARNVGLRQARAAIVGFPDDDCWYPPHLLQEVHDYLAADRTADGVGGRSVDEEGRPSGGRWDEHGGAVTRFNVWSRVSAYTVFLRRSAVGAIGWFDETLGLGPRATWPAAEDLDYVIRGVQLGCRIVYEPRLRVYHPQRREGSSAPAPEQGYRYGSGAGRVLRKNGLPAWFAAYYVTRSFGAAVLSLVRGRSEAARFYWAVGKGRLRGWRSRSTSS
jgi:glycosyltransferase involved in cell wall biosynthesis